MAEIEFEDFSIEVKAALEDTARNFLEEAASEIESQARRNSRKDTGQLKGSWAHMQNTVALEAKVGSPLENSIWEEFGTGEHALKGNGRKGGWRYQDDNGKWHFTKGKKPNHTLQRALDMSKGKIINRAGQVFREGMK